MTSQSGSILATATLAMPIADGDGAASIHDWLARFAVYVRAVDYAAARPF